MGGGGNHLQGPIPIQELPPSLYEKIERKIQSSRIITIIFTMETTTSDGISLGTDLFL